MFTIPVHETRCHLFFHMRNQLFKYGNATNEGAAETEHFFLFSRSPVQSFPIRVGFEVLLHFSAAADGADDKFRNEPVLSARN